MSKSKHGHNPIQHQYESFSDWKFDKTAEYFPSLKNKQKSNIQVILNSDEKQFESPYAKIKRQKNPSFSNKSTSSQQTEEPEFFSQLKSLSTINKENETENEDEEDIESSTNAMIQQKQQQEEYELAKYKEWKTKQIKTKEYIPRSDHHTPRTLEDLKNWNIQQEQLAKYKKFQHENIKSEEELRSHDLFRTGHIVSALRVPEHIQIHSNEDGNLSISNKNVNDNSLALSAGNHKFDFSGEQTYVIEGQKFFEYYIHKYGYYFSSGFMKISVLTGFGLYLCLYQNYVTQEQIIDALQLYKPYNYGTIKIASSDNMYDIWWNTLTNSCLTPMIITAGIYAKCKGEYWEYKELKKKPNIEDLKTDVLTLQNKKDISSNMIIHEIQLIKERRKERMDKLAPLKDVIDVAETFSPHRNRGLSAGGGLPFSPKKFIEKGMKLNKFIKKHGINEGLALFMGTSFSAMDPRRAGAHQNFGLLKLQTRLDEFGRVIPGWQRQSSKLFILPTVVIFFVLSSFW